jgi:hypothetical protein
MLLVTLRQGSQSQRLSLVDAQHAIATDWQGEYVKLFGEERGDVQ